MIQLFLFYCVVIEGNVLVYALKKKKYIKFYSDFLQYMGTAICQV